MKKKRFWVALIAMVILAGCATNQVWTKPDFDQGEWARDRYECSYNAQMLCRDYYTYRTVGAALAASINESICQVTHQKECLSARGYYLVDR